MYAGEYGGILTRYDHRTRQARNITVNQINPSGIDPARMKYRFQWTAPLVVSAHDPKTVYHAANVVFRTRDAGQTWEKVSGDLSRNDKQKQQWSGGPITGDNTGVEVYGTVFALAESPKQKGLLWAGTDDGRIHLSKDDAKTWTDVTANVPNLPDWGTVCCVEPSPHDAGTAFLVVRNYRMDDYRPYLWKTTDHGATWAAVTDGLDPKVHLHAVREDPKKKGFLYLGTERGVMLSPDAGKTWRSLQLNLPTVPVHDLVVKNDDLVVGTHGRSIWILDDLTVVREGGGKAPEEAVRLYSVRPATRWSVGWAGPTASFTRRAAAANPDAGAAVWFSLGAAAKGEVTVEVLDAAGKRVALAKGKVRGKDEPVDKDDDDDDDEPPKRTVKAERGLNRFVWDLTHDGATTIPGAKVDMGSAGTRVPVAPGKYSLKLTAGGKTLTQPVEVRADPRHGPAGPPAAAFAEQEKLGLRVRDDITALSGTVARLRAVKRQLDLRKDLLKDRDDAKDLLKQSEALGKALDEVEGKLHNPKAKISYDIFAARGGAMLYSQLAWLLSNLTDADGAPTRAQLELADELGRELAALTARFGALVAGDVARLNAAARALGVPDLYVPPVPKR